mmetsp:Transcript_14531/g.20332  ORF Transcript_14531/g.20332 Transcript_14531/m.20332 type:complete len:252 (-) Transcript_14531:58-813(-)
MRERDDNGVVFIISFHVSLATVTIMTVTMNTSMTDAATVTVSASYVATISVTNVTTVTSVTVVTIVTINFVTVTAIYTISCDTVVVTIATVGTVTVSQRAVPVSFAVTAVYVAVGIVYSVAYIERPFSVLFIRFSPSLSDNRAWAKTRVRVCGQFLSGLWAVPKVLFVEIQKVARHTCQKLLIVFPIFLPFILLFRSRTHLRPFCNWDNFISRLKPIRKRPVPNAHTRIGADLMSIVFLWSIIKVKAAIVP